MRRSLPEVVMGTSMPRPVEGATPRHAWPRVALGRILNAALRAPLVRAALDSLFRAPWVRQAFNAVYDRWGHTAIGLLFRKLYPADRPPGEFVWFHTAHAGPLLFPVAPTLSQSWLYAPLWSGPSYAPAKALYRWYMEQRPAGVFLDLGANRGMMSYPLARAGYACYCFEPQRVCTDYIARVRDLNGFAALHVVESAVSDEDRSVAEFFVSDVTFLSSFIRENVEAEEPSTAIAVRAITVDTFCRTRGVAPTLVKIDVEGWELQVLRGARDTLRSLGPDLLLEIGAAAPDAAETWHLLRELGYRVYAIPALGQKGLAQIESLEALASAPTVDFFCTRDDTLVIGGARDAST